MLIFEGELREKLKRPFGPVEESVAKSALIGRKVAAVGDFYIRVLVEKGVKPQIAVFDYICMRKPVDAETRGVIEKNYPMPLHAANPPGTITDELMDSLLKVISAGKGAVKVEGEEDLAALALMSVLPDGWLLVYGQPNEGMVLVETSDRIRANAKAFMEKARKK